MKFRAYKRNDKRGYLIQGLAFSNDEKNYSVGFILERINFSSGKSTRFELGTEANKLGRMLFDMFNDMFKKYGKLSEIKKVKMWISRLAACMHVRSNY